MPEQALANTTLGFCGSMDMEKISESSINPFRIKDQERPAFIVRHGKWKVPAKTISGFAGWTAKAPTFFGPPVVSDTVRQLLPASSLRKTPSSVPAKIIRGSEGASAMARTLLVSIGGK